MNVTAEQAVTYLGRCHSAAERAHTAHREARPLVAMADVKAGKKPQGFDKRLAAWNTQDEFIRIEVGKFQVALNAAQAGTVEPRVAALMQHVRDASTHPLPDYLRKWEHDTASTGDTEAADEAETTETQEPTPAATVSTSPAVAVPAPEATATPAPVTEPVATEAVQQPFLTRTYTMQDIARMESEDQAVSK
jgi:hypothetical protein